MGFSERELVIGLSLVPELGPVRSKKLLDFFETAGGVYSASAADMAFVDGIGRTLAGRIFSGLRAVPERLTRVIGWLGKNHARAVTIFEPEYPAGLKHIYDPPATLFLKGGFDRDDLLGLAVVGTRHPSPYGETVTSRLVGALAGAGITVISGLALGIDSAAHRAALDAGGRTIAVLGSGFDHIYPPSNKKLAERIAAKGVLVSEYPPDCPPAKQNFPRRNRIIAGLALGVLVTEAPAESGALITAKLALEYGRDVFAVPGSILSACSEGTNRLIKQGAVPVTVPGDIITAVEAYGLLVPEAGALKSASPSVTEAEKMILDRIPYESVHMDLLLSEAKDVSSVARLLLSLEIKGLIRKMPGNMLVRVA